MGETLKGSLESAKNAELCCICFEDVRDTVIMPCKHRCICSGDACTRGRRNMEKCPTCKGTRGREGKDEGRKKKLKKAAAAG